MQGSRSDRRGVQRHRFKALLRVRIWKSAIPESRAESENLSERGIFFVTDTPVRVGTVLEIFFKMPEEVTGEAEVEWMCTGHVVHAEPVVSPLGRLGVGMQFDCYEVARAS